jgi:photosystem II stability/assembly factor-like uncharacterized protein
MKNLILTFISIILSISFLIAQEKDDKALTLESDKTYAALKLRNIGPAFCSGRIADIAIHPDDDNVWYIAVGSGGVWKTKNAGVTWKPIFDDQASYSTGCITIDPNNPHNIWVGTGENVGGRHVGFGDGVYLSTDGGDSWKNMGLKTSEHISKIIVHPENSDIVWVAAQGPLWSSGGERGLYKTTDGGTNWEKVLGGNEWTGVTDLIIDPRNPDQLYAATWQRHRTVAALMGGGPDSGIHRSQDGGETWEKLSTGLPGSNMGKIGICLSPQKPDIIYAAIELDRKKGGVYKSTDRGSSWKKMSDAVSGATGPHYYQELYASPHAFDRLYLMDVRIQVSDDGGANFRRLNESNKHSDNHAIAFKADDPDYLLVGTDAGIYESFDLAENWKFHANLPLTQYYKVAVDDSEPFYKIYGGTQDNGSHGGPSQTDAQQGIVNAHWYKTLFADGHQSAIEPGNPNITYAETQQGGLYRIDQITGEQVSIQPQAGAGESYERYNWDAPILVSQHDPKRLYFASQRVWRSDNRGDEWKAISDDLTLDQERIALPIMGALQSWDNPWDIYAMSNYNTITSLAESPLNENILYAGTDDGIIQSTMDGGATWTEIKVSNLSGVPKTAFVNDIKADLHDENTVYVALDNHKYGDFNPYLYKSTNNGKTWKSISGNIPERHLTWRMVQDHIDPNLLFAATEFGIFVSKNGGGHWNKLKGAPTISFRDLAIQKREKDLVGASFGRGFFVLDDYSPLRSINNDVLAAEASIMPIKTAKRFNKKDLAGSQGAGYYAAENPPYGATITYFLRDKITTAEQDRKKKEKALIKDGKDVPFPGWDALTEEKNESKTSFYLIIRDEAGNLIKKVNAKTNQGLNRVTWDLQQTSKGAVSNGGSSRNRGTQVRPGNYTATLAKEVDGNITELTEPENIKVEFLREAALPRKSNKEVMAFQKSLNLTNQAVTAAGIRLENLKDKSKALTTALERADRDSPSIKAQLHKLDKDLTEIDMMMNGNPLKAEVGEKNDPTMRNRLRNAFGALFNSYGPTQTHKNSLNIAIDEFEDIRVQLDEIHENRIPTIEQELIKIGAPWIEGQKLPKLIR